MKNKKRLLNIVQIFYARPHLGGSGIMSMEVTKELAKKGHNMHVVSYPGTYLTDEEKKLGIKIHAVEDINYPCFKSEPHNATFASEIFNLSKTCDIDIIHANYAITHGEAALTAKRIIKRYGKSPKVIITNHGSDIHTNGHHKLLGPSIEDTLLSADGVTFVSKSLKGEAKKLFKLQDYGSVIYNFVDETKFSPISNEQKYNLREELNLPQNKTIVYHASNFRKLKNTSILVDAASILKEQGMTDIHFVLIGEGPDKLRLEEKVNFIKNISDMVTFTGRQENVLPYAQASDIGILPSMRESFGLTLLESMACGNPVIGSRVGGIPEIIKHNQNGYLTEYDNVDQIVYYIKKLHRNPDIKNQMGLEARETVTKKFSREKIVNKYENLYLKTLK